MDEDIQFEDAVSSDTHYDDVDTYTEYQDLPWGGDDMFETCNYYED
jgi:hypothetical protein